jgi:hypothetical protein
MVLPGNSSWISYAPQGVKGSDDDDDDDIYIHIYKISNLLTYLLHGAESFFRS